MKMATTLAAVYKYSPQTNKFIRQIKDDFVFYNDDKKDRLNL